MTALDTGLLKALPRFAQSEAALPVLIAMILSSNVRNRCRLTIDDLTAVTGLDKRSVTAAVEWLVSQSAIEVVPFKWRTDDEKADLPNRQNVYQLTGVISVGAGTTHYLYTGVQQAVSAPKLKATRERAKNTAPHIAILDAFIDELGDLRPPNPDIPYGALARHGKDLLKRGFTPDRQKLNGQLFAAYIRCTGALLGARPASMWRDDIRSADVLRMAGATVADVEHYLINVWTKRPITFGWAVQGIGQHIKSATVQLPLVEYQIPKP